MTLVDINKTVVSVWLAGEYLLQSIAGVCFFAREDP
jgi:hypothetical protein